MSKKGGTVNLALHAAVASVMFAATSLPARSAEWEPPPPMPDKFDWVQLKSGEWLKGEIKVMYEGSLEFESEELDLLSLDFADIKQLRSAQVLNVRMQGGETATGKVLLEDGSIKVLGDSPQQFDRAELLSVTAGVPKERNYWTGRVSAGGNLRSGNTDEVEASANVSFQRRTVENRVTPRLSWQLQQHQRRGIIEQPPCERRVGLVLLGEAVPAAGIFRVLQGSISEHRQPLHARHRPRLPAHRHRKDRLEHLRRSRVPEDALRRGGARGKPRRGHLGIQRRHHLRNGDHQVRSTSTTTTRSNSPTRSPASTTIT